MNEHSLERGGTQPIGAPSSIRGHVVTPAAARIALLIALAADVAQIVLLPLFVAGGVSPADDILDVIVGIVMIRLLGWHAAFLPTFVTKLIPFVDLFPTWTLAVLFVTRRRRLRSA